MLNPNGQTAVVFASVDFGDQTTLTITNNLMAGGGYMIYGGGSGSGGSVVGPVTITGNRFSRKYYPEGGSYGVASYLEQLGHHLVGQRLGRNAQDGLDARRLSRPSPPASARATPGAQSAGTQPSSTRGTRRTAERK